MTDDGALANWHPDPFGRHELRYWTGSQWTDHVWSNGRHGVDPPGQAAPLPTTTRPITKIVADVAKVGAGTEAGGGTIFTEPVLVVNQKVKVIEVHNEYATTTSTAPRSSPSVRSANRRPTR